MSYPSFRNAQLAGHSVVSLYDHIQGTVKANGGDAGHPIGHRATGGIIVHRNFKPLYVSRAWAALHDYEAEDILGMPSLEALCHPDDRARMTTYRAERAAGRHAPERYAYRALHKNGSVMWIDVSVRVIPWQGEPAILARIVGVRDASGSVVGRIRGDQPSTRSAELRLLNVIDQLPDGYALYDVDERLAIWNEHYANYAPEIGGAYRSGDRFEDLIRDHVRHGRIREAVGQEESWIAKRLSVFRAPDNRSMDISYDGRIVQARHIKTNDGGTLLILTDVTEAREHARSLSIYASAIDQVADRVSIIGLDYRYIFANKAVLRFHGAEFSSFVGRHIAEVIGEEQFQKASKRDLDRCFSGESVQTRRSSRDDVGRCMHLDLALEPFRNSDEEIIGAIVILRDVTEATKRNADLQLARSAIDQLSERMIIVDNQEYIRFVNQSSLEFHRRELDQVVGKHLAELIGWDRYHDHAASLLRKALATGVQSRHEYWRASLDGEPRYWETSVVPYRESDSTISGAIATSRDMTDHHRAERDRRQFQEAIEDIADGYALFDENEQLITCNRYYQQKHAALYTGVRSGHFF